MAARNNIILIGNMGSGKTTVSRIIAKKTGWRFYDLDRLIVAKTGMEIPEIFARQGEAGFRRLEREVLLAVLGCKKAVIAAGGGTVKDPANLRDMKEAGVVVYLSAPVEELSRRVGKGLGRPLLSGGRPADILARLAVEREPFYRQAHLTVNTAGLSPEEVADRIIALTLVPEEAERGGKGSWPKD